MILLTSLLKLFKNIVFVFPFFASIFWACGREEKGLFTQLSFEELNADSTKEDYYSVRDFGARGDSTDDTKALQEALNSDKSLRFPKGVYIISSPLKKAGGTINIVFDSGAVIRLAPSFPLGNTIQHGAFVFSDLGSANLTQVALDGNRSNIRGVENTWRNYISAFNFTNCNNVSLDSCYVFSAPSSPFTFQSCSNVRVTNCRARDYFGTGILFQSSIRCTANNNRIIGRGPEGDNAPGGVGILGSGSNFVDILQNWVDSSSDTGIKTEGCNDVVIQGNYVGHSAKDGIKFENRHGQGEGQPDIDIVYRGKILENVVDQIIPGKSDASCLIQSYAAQDVVIARNSVIGGGKSGLEDGIQIDQNPVFEHVPYSYNVSVYDNKVRDVNRFLYINFARNVKVFGNKFQNYRPTMSRYNGADIFDSDSIVLSGNHFERDALTSTTGCGINIANSAEIDILQNSIVNADCGIVASLKATGKSAVTRNVFKNLNGYFISMSLKPGKGLDSLTMTYNSVSNFGMGRQIGYIFKVDAGGHSCGKLNLRGNEIIGNGVNGDYALTINDGQNVGSLDISNFSSTGNATYPTFQQLGNCKDIIGWKTSEPPRQGHWRLNSVVYNIAESSKVNGWKCVSEGNPGAWKEF